MKLFRSAHLIQLELQNSRQKGISIGFVPTMGALHSGHLSLIQRAKSENDAVLCSIFVNPKQFNESSDLETYPRTIQNDVEMLNKEGVDYIFHPESNEIYDADYVDEDMDLNGLDYALEGKHRPGHFQGVAKVIKRLFQILNPSRAYFGQKDFQQTVVVRLLIDQFFPDMKLVVCSTVREPHGLAMSSRNERLSETHRHKAAFIYSSLVKLKERCYFKSIPESMESTRRFLTGVEGADLEYLAVVDGHTMVEVTDFNSAEMIVAVVVVKYGGVRLLDNVVLKG